jgi:hypothetical protein
MAKTLHEDSPWKMAVPARRDALTGEARRWNDRAERLRGRTLDIPASERTAFQSELDRIWRAVEVLTGGGEVDLPRLERVYRSLFTRWPGPLGDPPPEDLD